MCLRERREKQEVTGRVERPRRGGRSAEAGEARPAAARSRRRFSTSSGTPHGSPTSAATCAHSGKDVREEEGAVPRPVAQLRHFQGAGDFARSQPPRHSAAAGPERLGASCCRGPVVRPVGLHACPAGPSVTAQDAL